MDARIIFLKRKLLNNLQHQWTIEEMAEAVELSPSHLQKIFKTETGMPPIAYLREMTFGKSKRTFRNNLFANKANRCRNRIDK